MNKKKMKIFVAAIACATLLVGGMTVYAAKDPDLCAHDGYYIVDDYAGYYADKGAYHVYYYWAQIFCMDCFGESEITTETLGDHVYNGDNICDYCGHDTDTD